MERFNKYLIICTIALILCITIGYAFLSTTLNINGTSTINSPVWNIHFENVQVKSGSVSASTPTISNQTTVTYSVNLSKPGDYYEFTVDAKNDGSVDAMIDTIVSTLNNTNITTLPSYLNYSVSYSDGMPIQSNQELNSGEKETYKIRVEFKLDITPENLPTTEQNLNISFTTTYVQKDSTSVPVSHPVDFSTDSWETIIAAVQSGNTSFYNVGDTKTVSLGSLGTHTLRIANKSTPTECSQTGFSQTACGFVLEFEDIITTHNMNSSNTCTGGWPATSMRTYLNNTNSSTSVINLIPEVLRNAIIDTTVISSHGSSSTENNFTSTDKLYLLGAHEIWEDVDGNTNSGLDYNDTAYNNTRQLDYYSQSNVTTSAPSYSGAVKKRNGTVSNWYTRSPIINNPNGFRVVSANGNWSSAANASNNSGVSPAFRIG